MTINLGMKVKWVSQANGGWKEKVGTVVEVVDANYPPKSPAGSGWMRNHESYIVSVPGKTAKAKPKLYWPRVSALKVV